MREGAPSARARAHAPPVASLCRRLRDACVAQGCPARGLPALLAAARKAAPSPAHLTPAHVDALQLALLAQHLEAALPLVAGGAVWEVAPAATGVSGKDFLLFCLYGATLLVGLQRLPAAAELLMQALAAPALALNAIQLACYKKLVLVALLTAGAVPPLPKFLSSAVARAVKAYAPEYTELEKAVAEARGGDVLKALATHGAVYKADGNLGLAKQVAAAVPARAVARLTRTHVTLSLAEVAAAAQLAGGAAEAEALVRRLVGQGAICATLDARGGVASFSEDPQRFDTRASVAALQGCVARVAALSAQVGALERALALDPGVLGKAAAAEKGTADGTELAMQE